MKKWNSRKVELGTIISGTMREEDLISALVEELEIIDTKHEYRSLIKEGKKLIKRGKFDTDITSLYLNEDLFDALNSFAPSLCYFGSHIGDGSDYGF